MKGWLYSENEPEGKVFDGEEYDAMVAEGWVDTPALIGAEETESAPKKKPGRPKKVIE